MTEVVHKAAWDKQIKVVFRDLISSDRRFRRLGRKSWKLSWQAGKLIDTYDSEDLFAYHFVDSKNNPAFYVKSSRDNMKKFTISDKGIE